MDFLPPKNDFVFKRLFGDVHNTDILLAFLNAVLVDTHEARSNRLNWSIHFWINSEKMTNWPFSISWCVLRIRNWWIWKFRS